MKTNQILKDKKFSLKEVFVVITIAVLLTVTLSYVAWSGDSFTPPDIYLDNIPSTASYVIETDGTYYWATRYDGKIPSGMSGTDASTIINYALGNLTSGRTWQEKVILRGNITLTSQVLLPSYLYLEVNANITASFINTVFKATSKEYITVIGGTYNGLPTYGIYALVGCSNVIVREVNILGSDVGLYFMTAGSKNTVSDSYITSCDYGIRLEDQTQCTLINNHMIKCNNAGIILSNSSDNEIICCLCKDLQSADAKALMIDEDSERNLVIGGTYSDTTGVSAYGIYIYNSNHNRIIGAIIEDNGAYGVMIIAMFDTADNNTVIGNVFNNNSNGAIYDEGTNNVIKFNEGFVTENSGTATNSTATTFVFNHSLANTAIGVWASFNTTAISGWTWTSTSTQITITVTGTSLPATMACYWTAEFKP